MASKTKKQIVEISKFNKQQLLTAKNYKDRNDLLNSILKNDEFYTFEEVDKIIKKFMERETD